MPPVSKERRLLSLWCDMVFQENHHASRTVPSPYTIIKAEYGYAGTRKEVMDRVAQDIRTLSYVSRAGKAG